MHFVAGHNVALRLLPLDSKLTEINVKLQRFQPRLRFKGHFHHLCLAVGVCRKPCNARVRLSLREVIFLVAGHAGHRETFHEESSAASVLIYHIIDSSRVIAHEQPYMPDILPYKQLLGHTHHLIAPVVVEDDNIVEQRAVEEEFVFLQPCADKALLTVEIQFLIGLGHSRRLDIVETSYHRAARIFAAVFSFQPLEPLDGNLGHVSQTLLYSRHPLVVERNLTVGLVRVKLKDPFHPYLKQLLYILFVDVALQFRQERLKTFAQMGYNLFKRLPLLEFLILIHPLLDKNSFERCEMQLFFHLSELNLQLAAQQLPRTVGAVAQQIAHRQEVRLLL